MVTRTRSACISASFSLVWSAELNAGRCTAPSGVIPQHLRRREPGFMGRWDRRYARIMDELVAGVWHWQGAHPAYTEPHVVSSYAVDVGERLLLFDPIAAPDEL